MRTLLEKARSLLRRAPRPGPQKCRLTVTQIGLSNRTDDEELWAFRWEEVTQIVTYKADLFAVDMISLDFVVGSESPLRHTDDGMQGFDVLCSQLRTHYPGIAERWWFDVAFPAFETNGKILYQAPTLET